MHNDVSRRTALKWTTAAAGVAVGLGSWPEANGVAAAPGDKATASGDKSAAAGEKAGTSAAGWGRTHDRVWLGGEFWANPMEDWRVVDGAAECQSLQGNRSIHSLTHQLTNPAGRFSMSVRVRQVESSGNDGGAGFRVGIRSEINEYRSNVFAAGGVNAGIAGNRFVLGPKTAELTGVNEKDVVLRLSGAPAGGQVVLTLEALSPETGASLGQVTHEVAGDKLLGNVALVSGYPGEGGGGAGGARARARAGQGGAGAQGGAGGARYAFRDWTLDGDAFTVNARQKFGPILWSMYTLSDSRGPEGFVLKLSALTGPLGRDDSHAVELHVQQPGGEWKSLGETTLDPDAWVATFRVPHWDEKTAAPFKLIYREKHRDGSETPDVWTGTIRANPAGNLLRMAALTCQNDYAFPYEPVAGNVLKLDPDLVAFSGDQIYESHGGFGIIRDPAGPAILNYLRKFYQFGWSFREVMRDRPTLCIPDDHDVFQGNLWGEGGAAMQGIEESTSSKGGYREPARMVNVVHKTNVSHHPDPDDPAPSLQDISVYYGDLVYGGVSFAILADRQWKSGPDRVNTGGGRADHVADKNFDTRALDQPGLVLLGERQEQFLQRWADDWRGHTLKAVFSQTVFAGVATHHGGYDGYLKADLDCGSWPQTPRNRAVELMRPSMALHINGDQHLTSLTQYGVDKQRDGNWSFCSPAIAVGYPRWWRPDELGTPHSNRPKHGLADTGEYLDGFGNRMYVYAVGNPVVGKNPNRYVKAHEKGSGFGFITFDTAKKTYTIESYRFLIDATDGQPSNQFPGWPVTIRQAENRGENVLG